MSQETVVSVGKIAKICHEANRAYCSSLGDTSHEPWALAPQWQCDSVQDGVRFLIANPEAGPSASHENWLRHKQSEEWVYGEKKNLLKKTHPCMVPYEDLPPEQKIKDSLFYAIVRVFTKGAVSSAVVAADRERRSDMEEQCPVCKKLLPRAGPKQLDHFGLVVYVYDRDKDKNVTLSEHQAETICSKKCLIEVMSNVSKDMPKGGEYRIGLVLNTDDPGEVLAAFARQLRAFG